ncbi:2-hydroxyacid dehydrogenase [Sedimentitalea sp. HM32M-2]|uniref:2-hydroxyacid dehydrogenase n=1 Tax=Sedimentitalea sp. HM32M-2 TaxID=3351566 RepID=UPI0036402A73
MRLYITRPMPPDVAARACAAFQCDIRDSQQPLDRDEMVHALRTYDIVLPTLGDAFSAGIFAEVAAPRCRLLANFGVGYNHIDVDAARAAGLAVSNTPGAVTDATADIAMTLILMSARRAGEGERLVRAGRWQGWNPTQLLGLHVTGRTVGIVGMGRIGQAVARRCHFGFGMKVRYHSRSAKTLEFPAEAANSLADLAAAVDFLVIAVPGGAETHHLIGRDVLAAMRPQAHLVNISRGNVVDEAALIDALSQEQIVGAGLDVYEFEPQVPQALIDMENVVLLPHLGTAALDVRTAMGMMALDNAAAFAAGDPLPNPV